MYKWTWDGTYTGTTATTPTYIIFSANSGKPQQNDMTFKNGNYYNFSTVAGNVIDSPATARYTLSGVRLSKEPTEKGVYIHEGKKVIK